MKARLRIESRKELDIDQPTFDAEAAANFRLLVAHYESWLSTQKAEQQAGAYLR